MGTKWTDEQNKVIRLRDRNILVSAAAGSGKTAVLVERIIKILTDRENPTDVDRLLVVTFTEAAAAEMKQRVLSAIEKALAEEPDNEHLRRQATLIHSAMISTIHSFCLSVIREHFHMIGIDPSFRTAEEGELKLLRQDVMEEFLEERYEEAQKDFLEFTDKYAAGRDDKKIEELILKLYEYSVSYPEPEEWLDHCLRVYGEENREYEARILELVRQKSEDVSALQKEAAKLCREPDGPYMQETVIESDAEITERIKQAKTYRELYETLRNIKWQSLSRKKDPLIDGQKRERVRDLRDRAKKVIKDLSEDYFYETPEMIKKDMEDSLKSVETLVSLVKGFGKAFAEKKKAKNIIDFGDMEQFALRILTENKDGVLVPSAAAREYQRRFKEVMIDEYQDSNYIQETILTSVSTVGSGRNNIFMVGDVKQSIYRFRLSRPELFMEKYDTYTVADSKCQRIDLHKNFRSRKEVLDSVNFIFRQIMRRGLGNIEYDENAFLNVGAEYEAEAGGKDTSGHNTELILAETGGASENAKEDIKETPLILEARCTAKKIKELLRDGVVWDKDSGKYTRPSYKDIVILSRSTKTLSRVFSTVLGEEGIPVYSESGEGYFETYEVSILLDYLKLLDNFRQDLPLAAVLTSPFVGLDARGLAKIRAAFPEAAFYEAVRRYSSDTPNQADPEIQSKVRAFLKRLDGFREAAPFTEIHELLWKIVEDTGYGTYISAMPGGEKRKANVEMLIEKALDFEKTSYKGLFNFVRYIGQLQKYNVDYGEADISNEQSDAVRMMTIHKSKGLEFPIVFLVGMTKRFNTGDIKGSILIHPKWGVGINTVDLKKRTKAPTIIKKIIRSEIWRENLGEELRILYVALTRAKEKLIMIGSLSGAEEKIKQEELNCPDKRELSALPYYRLSSASCYMDWLLPLIPRITKEIPIDVMVMGDGELKAADNARRDAEAVAKDILENWDAENVYDEKIKAQLKEQLGFKYPYRTGLREKMKFSVSELKKAAYRYESSLNDGTPESVGEMFAEPEIVPLLPKFIKEETQTGGAYKGTAYHKVMELLDFTNKYDEEALREEVKRFAKEGRLDKEACETVKAEDILFFLRSGIGKRMERAAALGKLWREQPFVIGVDASRVYKTPGTGEQILVQGVIDVYFEEDGKLVLLDYKTDRVKEASELKDKYHAQLAYYAEALTRLTGKEVAEIYIYSFCLKKEISLKGQCAKSFMH